MHLAKKQLTLIIILAIAFGALSGFLALKYYSQAFQQSEIKKVFIPICFKEGTAGDFPLEMEKGGDNVILNWPEGIKVTKIRVYDLGDPRNPEDHQLVFYTANFKLSASKVESLIPKVLERFSPLETPATDKEFSEPTVYLTSPYQIGAIAKGFYNNTPEKVKPIFEKDGRYLIEVKAINGGKLQIAEYIFIFK